jgi:(1->4)-alpha-D-glucan 1-alpha-D-glucosylmutase
MPKKPEEGTRIPVSTYRLQLNHAFTFADAREILPYLAELGITDLYTSSYLKARPGSLHGYDIVDFGRVNDEIGNIEEYEAFVAEQKKQGLGQIFDLVPNHMCIASPLNQWWNDVLENGPSSVYAHFFDVNWHPTKPELWNKLLVPVLGDQYGQILENQELNLFFDQGSFKVSYWDFRFPIRPDTYMQVLMHGIKDLEAVLTPEHPHYVELLSINTALSHLPCYTSRAPEEMAERNREKEIVKRRLGSLYRTSPGVREFINANVRLFNGTKDDHNSFDLLDRLLQDQAFRLSYWRVATEEINYRRFFDINDLAAIRMEDAAVFKETHRLPFDLVRKGWVTGFRIDHPDGLYDPLHYFRSLQKNCFIQNGLRLAEERDERVGNEAGRAIVSQELARQYEELVFSNPKAKPFYVVGEKILMRNENMPEEWPIFSTTGYTFLNLVNGIFVETANEKAFDRIYRRFTRSSLDYEQVVYDKKNLIMQRAMSSEINMLADYLNHISEKNRHTRDFTLNSLRGVIVDVIAAFPVYRTYINGPKISGRDRQIIETAVSRAKRANRAVDESVFNFLKDVLLLQWPADLHEDGQKERLDFVMRFQQITGPVMAKGLEDTAFYVYNRLVSLNEVGGGPDRFGTTAEEFHEHNLKRQKMWPHAMITTSTHDSKRSEDVRARINVLSEMPEEWRKKTTKWSQINRKRRGAVNGSRVPDANEEYLFYQTLIGAWPIDQTGEEEYSVFVERIKEFMLKAMREAKVNTSWVNPRISYEEGVMRFVEEVLDREANPQFVSDFDSFQRRTAFCGMVNSLSQTLLKIMSPGVPDFYQGTEVWNLSLVDPDNRKPVDYDLRRRMLTELVRREKEAPRREISREVFANWQDGRIKMYVTREALRFRREHSRSLSRSRYTPLLPAGSASRHVCSFARRSGGEVFVVAVPRFVANLLTREEPYAVREEVWGSTRVPVPFLPPAAYRDIFTGETVKVSHEDGSRWLSAADLFTTFPVALLEGLNGEKEHKRTDRGKDNEEW